MGGIKRINQFPEGSGSLSSDDIFLFMDDPSGDKTTKKISLSQLSEAIGVIAVSGANADTGDIIFSGAVISTANTDQSMTITTNGSGDIYIGADRNMIFDMNAWSAKGILLQDSQEDGYDDPETPSILKVGSIYHDTGTMVIRSDGRIVDNSGNLLQTYGGIWITNGDDTGFRVPPPTGSSGPFSYDTIITNNDKDWNFTPSGDLILPVSGDIKDSDGNSVLGGAPFNVTTVDLHNGGIQNAQVLQFTDGDYQSVITGPAPSSGNNSQRIIIQGQRAQGNGEGGDVYVWGGDSDSNGGDIKIYAGDADNISPDNGYGGYVNIDGGKGSTNGGNVEITAGYSESGQAGSVEIVGGSTSNGMPGPVIVKTNNNIHIWTFNNSGDLEVPGNILLNNGTTVATGTFNNSTGGNNGISLNCAVGYELNWQGGHLISTQDAGISASNILCDSPLEFPGTGIDNMQIDSNGITYVDGTTQNSANISSSNIVDFNNSVSGLVSGNYAIIDHTHISADITDFNSSVSGLLTGLQPSGNYANTTHTHISTDITDFNGSVSGLIPVKNIISGSGIIVNNISGNYTINSTLVSNPSGITGASVISNIVQISQTDYDNLSSYDPNTVYIINT